MPVGHEAKIEKSTLPPIGSPAGSENRLLRKHGWLEHEHNRSLQLQEVRLGPRSYA